MERIDRYNIERFIEAQANETRGYLVALKEIKSGRKHEHWIWYIFPQAKGLGEWLRSRHVDIPEGIL